MEAAEQKGVNTTYWNSICVPVCVFLQTKFSGKKIAPLNPKCTVLKQHNHICFFLSKYNKIILHLCKSYLCFVVSLMASASLSAQRARELIL